MARLVEVDEIPATASKGARLVLVEDEPSKPFGQQLNESIADVPRQLGLTARAGLQGLGGIADLLSSPFRGAVNLLGADAKPGIGERAANSLGLPRPRPGLESTIGTGAEMVAGGLVPVAAGAALAKNATGVTQGVGRLLASNPGMQTASAAASGLAGGYTRETGGDDRSQLLASLAAGVGTPFALGGVSRAARTVAQRLAPRDISPQQIDITINSALSGGNGGAQSAGLNLSELPAQVAQGIRKDVADALKISDNLSPDAIRRLADYRLTGLTPSRAGLTLNPGDITRQRNLAKVGANSKDPQAQALAETQNANNDQLTQGLNRLGANTTDDKLAGGQRIMAGLSARNDRAKALIDSRYNDARATNGRSADLDSAAFTVKANNLLDDALLGGKLPTDVRNLLNNAATGRMPLTVDVAEQFKTRIGELQRASSDMAERKALGLVRSALDDAPLLPGQDIGQESINAFNKARRLNRSWMGIVDKTPALQAVRDGIEPDKFVNQFIIGSSNKANVMDVAMLKNSIKSNPDALQAVREQILADLKGAAKGGSADELVNFSQSAYNKRLNAIGDRKLRLFFDKPQIDQMKALGRVASYEQVQPVGSAVNNSNTASAGYGMLERILDSPLIGKIPFGKQAIGDPLQNLILSNQATATLSAPRSLVNGPRIMPPMPQRSGMMLSPAALIGTESEEDRKRRELGLLNP